MKHIAIWASGGGSNADVILSYFKNVMDCKIIYLGCNRKDAGAFDVAKRHNIEGLYMDKASWNADQILKQLEVLKIDFIVLAGFLKLVPKEVVAQYQGKIINIHPSLLPRYGGKNMYGDHVHKAVIENQETISGITIHEVNEEFDQGKLLAQYTLIRDKLDTLENLKAQIQQLEHTHFASIIHSWIQSKSV